MNSLRNLLFVFFTAIGLTLAGCGGGGTPASTTLAAPTGVQAVAGDRQVTISWNTVAGATSYNLYMATTAGVPKDPLIMHHSTTATSITPHTDLTNGTTWYFMVTALNATGESIASTEVSAIPAAPPPTATISGAPVIGIATAGNTQATVAFTAPANNGGSAITGYTATCGAFTAAGATSPLTVTGLANGTTYTCTVTATNAIGTSAASAEVSAIPAAPSAAIANTFSFFKRNGTATPQTATLLTDGTLNIDGKIITGINYPGGNCLTGGNGTTFTACFSPSFGSSDVPPHTMLLCGPDPTTSAAGTLLYVLFDSPDTNRVSATSTALLNPDFPLATIPNGSH